MAAKRKSYTFGQKLDILRGMESTSLSMNKYAASQGITSSMLRKWKKTRPSLEEHCADPGSSGDNIRRLTGAGAKTNSPSVPHPSSMSEAEHMPKHSSSTTPSSLSSSSASTGPKPSLTDNTTTATPYETLQTVGNSTNVAWHKTSVTRSDHEQRNGHRGAVLWFTGLSGSGKSTLANAVTSTLFHPPHSLSTTTVLDGDNVRHGLCLDLGFSPTDRSENIRRVGHLAKVLVDGVGCIVCTAFVSPYAKDRDIARGIVTKGDDTDSGGGCFVEVYCKADIATCEGRDTKGLYAKARSGVIPEFTGVSSPYEVPENPELVVDTGANELEECVEVVVRYLEERGIIPKRSLGIELGDGGGS